MEGGNDISSPFLSSSSSSSSSSCSFSSSTAAAGRSDLKEEIPAKTTTRPARLTESNGTAMKAKVSPTTAAGDSSDHAAAADDSSDHIKASKVPSASPAAESVAESTETT